MQRLSQRGFFRVVHIDSPCADPGGAGRARSGEPVIVRLIDGFMPFVFGILARNLDGKVHEPAVFGRAVPVLDSGGNIHDITGMQFTSRFAPFLIPAASGGAEQNLSPPFAA